MPEAGGQEGAWGRAFAAGESLEAKRPRPVPKRNSRAACGAPTGHFRGHLSWRPSQQLLGCHPPAGQIGSSAGLAPGGGPGLTDAEIDVDILVLGVFLKTLVAELAALAGLLVAA